MRFYVGMHHASSARLINPVMVSVNVLRSRKGPFEVKDWIMDSGAFSTIATHGGYPNPVEEYAAQIERWSKNGNLERAVSQDYMCEPWMIEKTGLSEYEHQILTIDRYDRLLECKPSVAIMPVLQGYSPESYVSHIRQYGSRLTYRMWVGVGSVCKRNSNVSAIEAVLLAIKRERPDLFLHGFGVKSTALKSDLVRQLLHSADSMAWSWAARRGGRNSNDPNEAKRWLKKITSKPVQLGLEIL